VPRKIIVDCDPGHDDAIALLLAHGSPDVELCAITTVMGNSTLANVSRNALAIAALAGIRDVPIAAGFARPLIGTLETSSFLHGDADANGGVTGRTYRCRSARSTPATAST
jgi:purine nucleosidase